MMIIDYRVERWDKPHAPNRAMLWYVLTQEGYQVFQWSDRPHMIFPQHKNDEEHSHWIISGTLEWTIERLGTVTLNAGDRDFMPANVWYSGRVTSEEPVVYLVGKKIDFEVLKKYQEEVAGTFDTTKTQDVAEPKAAKTKKAAKPKVKKPKTAAKTKTSRTRKK